MVFSSTIFIFFFLPITLAGYYILGEKGKNIWLLFASLVFYAWGGIAFLPIILYTILINYVGGLIIDFLKQREQHKIQKAVFSIVIMLNLFSLGYWKYAGFLLEIFRDITGMSFTIPEIVLPIGISFFTLQGMSYVIDLYREDVQVQKNLYKLALYISLFPQLIAGPIVRYIDIEKQLASRIHSIDDFTTGLRIFTVGLAKKAILANTLAITADSVFDVPSYQNTPAIAWIGLLCYSFQLYFDFSGYSDMAIGLGRMFGFRFMGNFNYPYISRSVSEIWRRWHISLSTWFKDYVYIPLGGNRKGNVYFNLSCVFVLTGLWHGASWNYVLWGVYYAVLGIVERVAIKKWNWKWKVPAVLAIPWTHFWWLMGLVLFRTKTIGHSIAYYKSLFGLLPLNQVGYFLLWYLDKHKMAILLISIIAVLPLGKKAYVWLENKTTPILFASISNMGTLVLLGISILYVVTGTYNPFIYFQF